MTQRKSYIEQLFRQHRTAMLRTAVMLLHDEEEGEDIVHDVFTRLLRSDTQLKEESAERFLLTSVRNRCLNVIRNMRIQDRAKRLLLLDEEAEDTSAEQLETDTLHLLDGMEHLHPPVCREILLMHFRDGMKFREIAERLGVSETTVYKHLRNALNQLRNHMTVLNNGEN